MFYNYLGKQWYGARGELYKEMAESDWKINEVRASLSKMEWGWIDFSLYVDGKEKTTLSVSAPFNSIQSIRDWLESIVEENPISILEIEEEGHGAVLVYEHLQRREKRWSNQDLGLFYVFDSLEENMPVKAICKTKDFVETLYMTFLTYAGFRGASLKKPIDFYRHWFFYREDILEEEEDAEAHGYDNWRFYEEMKSPRIEWYVSDKKGSSYSVPQFEKQEKVTEMIDMWAEWGEALFWVNDGCCGDCEVIHTDSGDIDLTGIKGLKEWYEEFNCSNPCEKWPAEKKKEWNRRGFELAKAIRKILPDHIDLCYDRITYKHKIENMSAPLRMVPNTKYEIL